MSQSLMNSPCGERILAAPGRGWGGPGTEQPPQPPPQREPRGGAWSSAWGGGAGRERPDLGQPPRCGEAPGAPLLQPQLSACPEHPPGSGCCSLLQPLNVDPNRQEEGGEHKKRNGAY